MEVKVILHLFLGLSNSILIYRKLVVEVGEVAEDKGRAVVSRKRDGEGRRLVISKNLAGF